MKPATIDEMSEISAKRGQTTLPQPRRALDLAASDRWETFMAQPRDVRSLFANYHAMHGFPMPLELREQVWPLLRAVA